MDITEVTILHHVGIVFLLIWGLSSFNYCHPLVYILSFLYLFVVHERYDMRLRRKVQFEERRQANQRRVLSDSESVRWLNHAIEKIWPVCMEQIVSQKILLPIVPWFLQKYKPWTVKDALVQSLYLGRSPPMFTEMRVLRHCPDDDHLVLELGMNFRTAEDMSAILAVKLRKRLGFGMWAKLHLLGMHVEGKVLVGVKFINRWPFLGRLRVCFVEPPYFQMTVKPVIAHGLDVTELPGIAGWMDKLLGIAFEETLVEPNMLVVDVEKFASPEPENWFSVDAKDPIAYALVEVIEASDMKPADLNGLADPYVKGQLGVYRFRTKTRKKTLTPKWLEEFKIPICTWESPNVLNIEVRDKDHFIDDTLGDCSININDLQDGQRHDMWLNLENIKMGRLHIAIRVLERDGKVAEQALDGEPSEASPKVDNEYKRNSFANDSAKKGSFSSEPSEASPKVADKFDPIDVEGQRETGIWVHHPGPEVPQKWEPRKGKNRVLDSKIQEGAGEPVVNTTRPSGSGPYQNDTSSTDESLEENKTNSKNPLKRGLHKISSVFHRTHKQDNDNFDDPLPSPHPNLKAVNTKNIGVNFVMEENLQSPNDKSPKVDGMGHPEENGTESPNKRNVKDVAKSILKHAGKSARGLRQALSRKDSSRSRDESREVSVESDSSDEESLPSAACKQELEADSVVANSASAPVSDPVTEAGSPTESNKVCAPDVSEQPITTIIATTMEKVGVDSPGTIVYDSSSRPQVNNEELATSSSPKRS